MTDLFPAALWIGVAAVATGCLLLLAWRKSGAALKLGRAWIAATMVLGLRLALWTAGMTFQWWEWFGMAAMLAAVPGSWFLRGVWLSRASADELRLQIVETCQGLLLSCEEESPGRFMLSSKGTTAQVRLLVSLGRWQLVSVPRAKSPGKIALFTAWLAKQYPGPWPRMRIVLSTRSNV